MVLLAAEECRDERGDSGDEDRRQLPTALRLPLGLQQELHVGLDFLQVRAMLKGLLFDSSETLVDLGVVHG